jgi:hypothetical protein
VYDPKAAALTRAGTSSMAKRRFSELSGKAGCNQEYAGSLKQRLNDEAELPPPHD